MEVPDGVAGAGVVDPRGKNKFRAGGEIRGVVLLSKIPIGVCVGEGVEGKSGPRRRRKVNGVWTAGRCKNPFEFGEPICEENILELAKNWFIYV